MYKTRNENYNNNTLNFKGTLNIIFNKTIKHVLVTTQDKNSFLVKTDNSEQVSVGNV